MSTARPLTLPHLSSGEAAARSALATMAAGIDVPALAGGLTFSLCPIPFAANERIPAERLVRWSGAQFAVSGTHTLERHLVAHAFGGDAANDPPLALREVALERFLAALVESVGLLGRGTPELVDEAPSTELRFAYRWQAWPTAERTAIEAGCPAPMHGELYCDSLGQLISGGLATAQKRSGALRVTTDAMNLRVLLGIRVGHAKLPLDALQALRPADIILLDDCTLRDGVITLTIGASHGWRARIDDQHLVILNGPTNIMNLADTPVDDALPADDSSPSEAELYDDIDAEPLSLDALPVTLTFDLGQRQMTVTEALNLSAGVVLDLGRPIARAVTIRSGGLRIGEGELVEIDGRIGVSIVRMISRTDSV